jgi:hypothetical protein
MRLPAPVDRGGKTTRTRAFDGGLTNTKVRGKSGASAFDGMRALARRFLVRSIETRPATAGCTQETRSLPLQRG